MSIHHGGRSEASSATLAGALIANLSTPSKAVMRAEMAQTLETALDGMAAIDREVLVLRHFEELTNNEVAEVLGLQPKAASIRYVRAVAHLKGILEQFPEFNDEPHQSRERGLDNRIEAVLESTGPRAIVMEPVETDRVGDVADPDGVLGDTERDPVEAIADDYVARRRRGETPTIDEYAARCPERAEEIRALFPAIAAMRRWKPQPGPRRDRSGDKVLAPGRLGDCRLIREIGRRGHGDRVRGRARVARPPRCRQGVAADALDRRSADAAVRSRGQDGGQPAARQHRPGLRSRRGPGPALLHHAADPGGGSGPGRPRTPAEVFAINRRCRGRLYGRPVDRGSRKHHPDLARRFVPERFGVGLGAADAGGGGGGGDCQRAVGPPCAGLTDGARYAVLAVRRGLGGPGGRCASARATSRASGIATSSPRTCCSTLPEWSG